MNEPITQSSLTLVEYIVKTNPIGARQLLMSYGIMADSKTKLTHGLLNLMASADEDTIFKIIKLDPNADLHQAYYEKQQEEKVKTVFPVEVLTEKQIANSYNSESLLGQISISNLIEILVVLAILFAIMKMFLMITQMFKSNE